MSKRELIDEIVRLNPTARPDFLAHFKDQDLREYLDHLNWLDAPAARPDQRPQAEALESSAPSPAHEAAAQADTAQSAVAVAEMDEPAGGDEESADHVAESAQSEFASQPLTYEDELATRRSQSVAYDDSDDPSPFADQTQESQTYLF